MLSRRTRDSVQLKRAYKQVVEWRQTSRLRERKGRGRRAAVEQTKERVRKWKKRAEQKTSNCTPLSPANTRNLGSVDPF
jgi:hypothetical protein